MQSDPEEINRMGSVERRREDEDDEPVEIGVSREGVKSKSGVRFSDLMVVAEESPRVSDLDAPEELASGATTVVDPAQHINKSQRTAPHNSLEVPKTREANLKDLARIISNSTRFSHVTPAQIERVRAMHDRLSENAKFSFNYNVLLLVASILAGLGLVSNSSTIVIASMLVSPIMGPVVGMAYGTTIRDWKLVRRSFKTEGISIVFCVVVGTAISAICGTTQLANDWPTDEMRTRGTWENFLVGLPVAFFSGLGVAVSLLDEQTSSLVGVAISASLLPPAVNAGVVWVAYAFLRADNLGTPEILPVDELGNDLTKEDFKDQFVQAGMVSLFLTVANIVLIFISAILMFRMKEVLPIEKKIFWNDLGVARKIYQKRALMTQLDTIVATDPSWNSGEENHDEQQQRRQKRREKHFSGVYKDASSLAAES